MGRELKRVPLDFEWPLNKPWSGFLNPHYTATDCAHCGGSGSSPLARRLNGQWYGQAPFRPEDRGSVPFLATNSIIRARAERNVNGSPSFYGCGESAITTEAIRLAEHFNRCWRHHLNSDDVAALLALSQLKDLTHTWAQGDGWKQKEPAYTPTPQEVNAWSLMGFGHCSINQWIVVTAMCERFGESSVCGVCNEEAVLWPSTEDKDRYEAWEPIEPPTGEGFQVWETVSEGSPISPVCATADQLAQYMAVADDGATYEQWLKFIQGPGWAPSLMLLDGRLVSGVEAVSDEHP